MENCFTYYQRYKIKNYNFYASYRMFLHYYDDSANFVLQGTPNRIYSFTWKKCKMLTFVGFTLIANQDCVIYLKERQILGNARKKKYMTKRRSRRKEKRLVNRLEKLILNRYILVNIVFLKKSLCFYIFDF